jgi:hypothetical protein
MIAPSQAHQLDEVAATARYGRCLNMPCNWPYAEGVVKTEAQTGLGQACGLRTNGTEMPIAARGKTVNH